MIMIDDAKLPMHHIQSLQTEQSRRNVFKNSYFVEPPVTDTANKRTVEILDAKYEKADLPVIVEENCQYIISAERTELLRLLQKYEQLFDGTLGDWKTRAVRLELWEGVWPFHDRAYSVPIAHKDTLKKEVKILEKLGVLQWEGDSEWGSPIFIMPKKDGRVCFLTDFREVINRLKNVLAYSQDCHNSTRIAGF